MRILSYLFFSLIFILLGCGEPRTLLPKISEQDVIVAFGDSLTYGTGAGEEESYPIVLGELIKRKVIRAGVPGETTEQGLQRLPSVLDEHQPKLLLLCLGGNDMLRKVDDKIIAANLRELIKVTKARGINVVLIGVPRPALLAGVPEFYAELAGEFNLVYESVVLKEILYSSVTKSDAIHPNAKGYRKMAETIAALLKHAKAI